MSFPALDLESFQSRTVMPSSDVDIVEANQPGFTATRIRVQSGWIYAQLRKRYAKTIPFGQNAPLLEGSGTLPPSASLTGRPVMGAFVVVVQITLGGPVGTAQFQWSSDAGETWTTGVLTAASVPLGATGMSVVFPSTEGDYATDMIYTAAPPCPETFLEWLTVLVTLDLYDKRGSNPSDPALVRLEARRVEVRAEIQAAANSEVGLWDLPSSEDEGTTISSGGPLGCSSASPYVWTDDQGRRGRYEDSQRRRE